MKRLAIINEDGTLEIGGVKCRVVPVTMPLQLQIAGIRESTYDAMLSAATLDLSGLPGVPERETNLHLEAQILRGYQDGWNAALDAIGVK